MKLVLAVLGAELLRIEVNEPDDHSDDDLGSTIASQVERGPGGFGFGTRSLPSDVEV